MRKTYELEGGSAGEGPSADHAGEGALLSADGVEAAESQLCSALHDLVCEIKSYY